MHNKTSWTCECGAENLLSNLICEYCLHHIPKQFDPNVIKEKEAESMRKLEKRYKNIKMYMGELPKMELKDYYDEYVDTYEELGIKLEKSNKLNPNNIQKEIRSYLSFKASKVLLRLDGLQKQLKQIPYDQITFERTSNEAKRVLKWQDMFRVFDERALRRIGKANISTLFDKYQDLYHEQDAIKKKYKDNSNCIYQNFKALDLNNNEQTMDLLIKVQEQLSFYENHNDLLRKIDLELESDIKFTLHDYSSLSRFLQQLSMLNKSELQPNIRRILKTERDIFIEYKSPNMSFHFLHGLLERQSTNFLNKKETMIQLKDGLLYPEIMNISSLQQEINRKAQENRR